MSNSLYVTIAFKKHKRFQQWIRHACPMWPHDYSAWWKDSLHWSRSCWHVEYYAEEQRLQRFIFCTSKQLLQWLLVCVEASFVDSIQIVVKLLLRSDGSTTWRCLLATRTLVCEQTTELLGWRWCNSSFVNSSFVIQAGGDSKPLFLPYQGYVYCYRADKVLHSSVRFVGTRYQYQDLI